MDWVACVGIDWGDREHAYVGRTRGGSTFRGTFKASAEEVHQWARQMREQFGGGKLIVAVEQGRGSLLYALMSYEFVVLVPINPCASKAYRDSLRLSGASSDPADAALICEFAFKHIDELRAVKPDDVLTRKLRLLAEDRRRLVDQRTAFTHMLAETLKQYFPQALEWFGGESSPCLVTFLGRWLTLAKMRKATAGQLTTLFRSARAQHACRRGEELLAKLRAAVALTDDEAIVEAKSRYAESLILMLVPLARQIEAYDQAIAALWAEHPDRAIFDSLPGAGPVLAPRLAAAFGQDRARYSAADELQCYSGIAPVVEQSGKQRWVHSRYGFPKFLHQTFHEFAQSSMLKSRWARAFYQEQRSRGAGHHQAIRSLAFRWIRIVFRLWKTRTTYDEQHYIDALTAKGSPLVARLAA